MSESQPATEVGAKVGKQSPTRPCRCASIVVYPHMVSALFVGRDKTVRALEEAMRGDKSILLVTQKKEDEDDPANDAIYEIGVVATVLQLLKLPDGTVKVLVEGRKRATGTCAIPPKPSSTRPRSPNWPGNRRAAEHEAEALSRAVVDQFDNYVKLNKKVQPEGSDLPAADHRSERTGRPASPRIYR